jgi:hypothetical protein
MAPASWQRMGLTGADRRTGSAGLKAVSVFILLVAAIIGSYLFIRPKPAPDAGAVVGFSAPRTAQALHVIVLRGGSTGCRPTGGCNEANYAQVLSAKEGWITTVLAQGGTGYVNGADNDPAQNFQARLPDVYNASPDLVIVEGSVSDEYYTEVAVQLAALALFKDLKTHLPNATVVAIGPAWAGTPPANVVAVEDAVKAAAAGRVALFIDPIAGGWFDGANESLMDSDHQSLTDQGHAHMAAMIAAGLAHLHLQATSSSSAT